LTSLPDLTVADVTVRFGGVLAVDRLSLHAPAGRITGLIGPNGAGKTTTFNACTGSAPMENGSVRLGRDVLDSRGPARRATMGLGRTFQRMELWDSMRVEENVALGIECFYAANRPWSHLFGPRTQQRDMAHRAGEAIARCGLEPLRSRTVGDLSTGQRRMVELARAIASPFRFLLLDEPASGLDGSESEHFAQVLGNYVQDSGVGVLLVEHDMPLVAAVCSTIFVMDFGRLIFSGTTAETMASDVVRSAYLGDTEGTPEPLGKSSNEQVAGAHA
jgi:ABC-type branched-subunit amino acid transport system ATPase component